MELSRQAIQLDKLYPQYKLKLDILNLKQQPKQSVADFYSQISLIWNQLALIEPNWTHDAGLYYQFHEEFRLVQFLMTLRDEFEFVRTFILYQSPLPSIDTALSELIAVRKKIVFSNRDGSLILAAPVKPSGLSQI